MVGNIHEKKIYGKNFSSLQATDHYKLLYLFVVRKFHVFNFCHSRIFQAKFTVVAGKTYIVEIHAFMHY